MQVDLSDFYSVHDALVNTNEAELAVARAFAAAANATYTAHQRTAAPQSVTVELSIRRGEAQWSRRLKDMVLTCVDRAMGRVYPPLDVAQYISGDSPAFFSGEDVMADAAVRVVFSVRPSTAVFPAPLLTQHAVEGEVVHGVELPEPESTAPLTAAASEFRKDTVPDMDLWYRARAAHQQYDTSIPLDTIDQLAGLLLRTEGNGDLEDSVQERALLQVQHKQQEEKLAQLQWRLARWLAELFLNERGWVRPRGSSGASAATSSTRQGHGDAVARQLFNGPLRPAFPHVVDAALFSSSSSPPPPLSHASDRAATAETVSRRQLHADVRGIEWDGLLIGYTMRYAYIAVPYFVSAAEKTMKVSSLAEPPFVWSLVSRVPIPSFVRAKYPRRVTESETAEADGVSGSKKQDAVPMSKRETRKRTWSHANTEANISPPFSESKKNTPSLGKAVLSRCFNVEEVMRHDTETTADFRLADEPHIVTVRAHRVFCARADVAKQPHFHSASTSLCAKKPHPASSPYMLSLVLEDTYVVAHRPASDVDDNALTVPPVHWAAALVGVDTAKGSSFDSLARSLHTFADVVDVVKESCCRFLRSHKRFCGIHERCLAAEKLQRNDAVAKTSEEGSLEGKNGTAAKAMAQPECRDLPSQAVAANQLRLLRRADDVHSSITDSVSVHYKKLRGASRVAIPAVHTITDIAALEESNVVEFKARIDLRPAHAETLSPSSASTGRGRGKEFSTMNAERLRNTIASMAAGRGGLILIGVADDGRIVGHPQELEVRRHVRTTGFCPAMVKDAVQVKELRLMETAKAKWNDTDVLSDVPVKRAMPENWWKAGSTVKSGLAPTTKEEAAAAERVVTVISVEKGQAPFYATAKNTPPYQRGCASTVVMPTVVLARRLMKELA